MKNIDLSHIRGINLRTITVNPQKHSTGASDDPSTVQEKPASKESTKRTRLERRVSFTKCKGVEGSRLTKKFTLIQEGYILKKGHCDFFGANRLKPVKVANQAISGFTPFTTFKLANSEKSHRGSVTPGRPKFVSVCGGHYAR
jgi:hypothetical protein